MTTILIAVLALAALVMVMIYCLFASNHPQLLKVKLASCYSLNFLENLLINGFLPETKCPKFHYALNIEDVLFNTAGEVYILREIEGNTIWHHFSATGEDLGLVKKHELVQCQHRQPNQCQKYRIDRKTGRLTVYLPK